MLNIRQYSWRIFRRYCFNSCMKYLAALIILLSMKRKIKCSRNTTGKKAKIIQLCFPTQILRWFSGGSDKTSVNVPIGIYSWKLLSMLTANTTGSPYKKHKKVIWLCTLTELITEIRHCPEFLKLTVRASTPSSVRREGLTLKTLVSETFYGGQCTFINSIDRLSYY